MSPYAVPVNYAAPFAPPAFGGGGGDGERIAGDGGGGGGSLVGATATGVWSPVTLCFPVDWKENPREHVFMADLPGMRMEEIKVDALDDRILRIQGKRQRAAQAADEQFLLMERPVGSFTRVFYMPNNADLRRARAEMESGELTVVVPKVRNRENEISVTSIPISIDRAGN
ncbi:18.1 kDa class I heat shock protein-like [Ananas comosus]|uniref:18.1 kDa class I heat shock protein-like n=1 Tax=Ananas comosus TaxID=4615 RepID=A0A6P5H2B7_ANACO|nr:18.1 kDa class I heat shock protein-like [Ananas comosus]